MEDTLSRLLEQKRLELERARVRALGDRGTNVGRRPRRDIRVRYFPSTENRGRATRGAEPIASRTRPTGHSS